MMRGAQSGGVVTYLPAPNGHGMRASRSRVVNKKRTDLSKMLTEKLRWDTARRGFLSGPIQAPTLFSGEACVDGFFFCSSVCAAWGARTDFLPSRTTVVAFVGSAFSE